MIRLQLSIDTTLCLPDGQSLHILGHHILSEIPSCLAMSAIQFFFRELYSALLASRRQSRLLKARAAKKMDLGFGNAPPPTSVSRVRSPMQTLPSWCAANMLFGRLGSVSSCQVSVHSPFQVWVPPPQHPVIFQCLSVRPREPHPPRAGML